MQQRAPRLEGKVAIVTGAGASTPGPQVGTGKAMSILFAREGAIVLVVDRDPPAAEVTLVAVREEGGQASIFQADVSKTGDCRDMVEAAVSRYGRLDILVNNAAILMDEGSVLEVTEEQWDRVLGVNLKSIALTGKYAIPAIKESGGGAIVNISSTGGLHGGPNSQVSYNASKGGVIGLTYTMAAQHGRDGVRVNCIAPGSINGTMLANEEGSFAVRATPLGTVGTGWDVAWTAVFLASDEARWITGAVVPVDGGSRVISAEAAMQYF